MLDYALASVTQPSCDVHGTSGFKIVVNLMRICLSVSTPVGIEASTRFASRSYAAQLCAHIDGSAQRRMQRISQRSVGRSPGATSANVGGHQYHRHISAGAPESCNNKGQISAEPDSHQSSVPHAKAWLIVAESVGGKEGGSVTAGGGVTTRDGAASSRRQESAISILRLPRLARAPHARLLSVQVSSELVTGR
jgi:hypothetical protein